MRVFVLAPYPTLRAGLAALVRSRPEWTLAGEGMLALEAVPTLPTPPVAPVDVVLADVEGAASSAVLEAWVAALGPRAGLVALLPLESTARGGHGGPDLLAAVARLAQRQGLAFAALGRDATAEEVLAAVASVGEGLVALDRRLATTLLAAAERVATPVAAEEATGEPLTPRELEVLQLLAQGLPNKLIAGRLHISENTAKFHVSAILLKLGALSRTEAVTRAARRGLLLL